MEGLLTLNASSSVQSAKWPTIGSHSFFQKSQPTLLLGTPKAHGRYQNDPELYKGCIISFSSYMRNLGLISPRKGYTTYLHALNSPNSYCFYSLISLNANFIAPYHALFWYSHCTTHFLESREAHKSCEWMRFISNSFCVTHAAPAVGAAAGAPEWGALAYPSALTPTSSWWAMVAL
jgi:hypothetical protein